MPQRLPKKNDQVFQLTLTELAFMLVFLMMLLTGWMVLEANQQAGQTAEKLKQSEGELKRCGSLQPENHGLKIRIAELERQTGALSAFLEKTQTLTAKNALPAIMEELTMAIAFKKAFEEASGKRLDSQGATQQGWNCVTAQAKNEAMEKERQNLLNQVAFMRNQLETLHGKKGFGQPPCWVDNNGRVQRLLAVEVTDQGLVVRPGWPAERAEDVKKLPNLPALLAGGKTQSAAAFHTAASPLLEWGKQQRPECRLYASVTVSATRVDASLAGQNAVFDHFFPYGKVTMQKAGR